MIIVHAVPLQLCIHPIISSVLRKRKKRFAEFFNTRSVAGIGSSFLGAKVNKKRGRGQGLIVAVGVETEERLSHGGGIHRIETSTHGIAQGPDDRASGERERERERWMR